MTDPYKEFKWQTIDPEPEPSVVDRLAAMEDPDGVAGQRCRDYDAQQRQLRVDTERLKSLLDSPTREDFFIDINDPTRYTTKGIVDEDEDGRTYYAFGVRL